MLKYQKFIEDLEREVTISERQEVISLFERARKTIALSKTPKMIINRIEPYISGQEEDFSEGLLVGYLLGQHDADLKYANQTKVPKVSDETVKAVRILRGYIEYVIKT